ncbi:MAG: protein kinase domain-containing protein [Xanthobacteraceae bacterium]
MARLCAVGDVIDGFQIEQEMPSGGQASLWRVRRPDIDFPILMKVPLLRSGEDPLSIVAFEVEQMILPRLSGVHVPRFVAAGDFDGPYIVMEYIEGASLKSRLATLPLPYAEVASIGAKVAAALHDIHRQNVIHLDLKPSNIMLSDRGEAVLIDFGLSRHTQLPDLPAEELEGPFGTGAYIAPEQLHGVRSDPRSDLFALGVILYFLSTGERPHGDPMAYREWRRRLYWDPVPPKARRADYPPWLQEVVLRCLERDPGRRYQTAAQAAFDLHHSDQVILTERSMQVKRAGAAKAVARWLRQGVTAQAALRQVLTAPSSAPIVIVALDFSEENAELAEALRAAVRRILQTEPGARLACINVFKLARLRLDEFEDSLGRNIHLQRLAELQHWARPLSASASEITYHVIEATDPATALIEFTLRNHADHVVLGARASSRLRRYLGSVSARVVAEVPCTVTVVRTQ